MEPETKHMCACGTREIIEDPREEDDAEETKNENGCCGGGCC